MSDEPATFNAFSFMKFKLTDFNSFSEKLHTMYAKVIALQTNLNLFECCKNVKTK